MLAPLKAVDGTLNNLRYQKTPLRSLRLSTKDTLASRGHFPVLNPKSVVSSGIW